MWYWLLYGVLAVWVLGDGAARKANGILWAVGTLLLGPLILPVYLAKRPLKSGEVREGGTAWNVLKNFAILWTVLMAIVAVMSLMAVSQHTLKAQGGAEQAGAALGTVLGLGVIGAFWFFPMVGALMLGLMLKKSSVVERGPGTSEIAQGASAHTPTKKPIGPLGWVGIVVLGLLVLGGVGNILNPAGGVKATAPLSAPATPATWHEIGRWQGKGTKNTETFHIPSQEWRIAWSTKAGDLGAMNFQIMVYKAGWSFPITVAANVVGEDTDQSIMRGAGDYYLTINTAQPYMVIVEANY